jgi:hypothetical protein
MCGVFPFEKNHKLYILVHVIFEKENFAVALKKSWVSLKKYEKKLGSGTFFKKKRVVFIYMWNGKSTRGIRSTMVRRVKIVLNSNPQPK